MMQTAIVFPAILVNSIENQWEGVGGLQLKSLLKSNLLADNADDSSLSHPLNPRRQHQEREALLQAISGWPQETTLELHLTALPDLLHKPQGNIHITLFLRAIASTEERVREEIINRYLNLLPLLSSHMSWAEFTSLTTEAELKQRMTPFTATHAVTVHRREESFSLSTPLKRVSVGYLSDGAQKPEKDNLVHHRFPWVPPFDSWERLLQTLMGQLDPIQIIIRLQTAKMSEAIITQLHETIRTCEIFINGCQPYQITFNRQAELLRDITVKNLTSLQAQCFNLGVFILAPHPIDSSLGNVLGRALTDRNGEKNPFQGGMAMTEIHEKDARKFGLFIEPEPFSLEEAACAFRFPAPPVEDTFGLPLKGYRTSLAQLTDKSMGAKEPIELFINEHHGMVQSVSVGLEDRMRHTFILGQTGTGKSTLMESMILQDIRAGRGVGVIDPSGELVDNLVGKIPPDREEDVIIFDLLDRERPVGFNLLQWKSLEERDLIIDELYLTLDRIYDFKQTGGPVFELNFRGMLKLLMGDKPRGEFIPTIFEFNNCFLYKQFRVWLKKTISDQQLLDSIEEIERTQGDLAIEKISPYITSKFARFVNDISLKRIIGQGETSFNIEEIINNGKIFLINLGKGRFGATVSALLANQMVSRFKLAAMKRGDKTVEERRDFFLYVDEAHNLPAENFMELLSEARKYRMGLILGTQYTSQLRNESLGTRNHLLSAVLGNVGSIIMFRLGLEDAKNLASVLYPCFSYYDIMNLPNWQGYARMNYYGETTPPFSFRTIKDSTLFNRSQAFQIRNASRMKYGIRASIVDAEIEHRRSIWEIGLNKHPTEGEDKDEALSNEPDES